MEKVVQFVAKLDRQGVVVVRNDGVVCESPYAQKLRRTFPALNLVENSKLAAKSGTEIAVNFPLKYGVIGSRLVRFNSKPIPYLEGGEGPAFWVLVAVDLQAEAQAANYLMNNVNQGIALLEVGPETSPVTIIYQSRRFAQLLGQTNPVGWEDLIKLTSPVIGKFLLGGSLGESELLINSNLRIVRNEPDRPSTTCRLISVMLESRDEDIPEPSSRGMTEQLATFLHETFDARFYVDADFRIVSEDESIPRLRAMVLSNSLDMSVKLEGRFVESLFAQERDQIKFRGEFIPKLAKRCETFRTRIILANNVVSKAKLYVTTTFADMTRRFDQESIQTEGFPSTKEIPWIMVSHAAAQTEKKYLVGLKLGDVVEDEEIDTSGPYSQKHRQRLLMRTLDQVPEDTVSQSENGNAFSDFDLGKQIVTKQKLTGQALERCIARDLVNCEAALNKEKDTKDGYEWLIPLFEVTDLVVLEDDLIRTIPTGVQRHFTKAVRKNDVRSICDLLRNSNVGSIDPTCPGIANRDQVDLVHCAFRFLVGVGSRTANPFRSLGALQDSLTGLKDVIGEVAYEVALLELTLGLIAAGLRSPKLLALKGVLDWLRESFIDVLKLRDSGAQMKSNRLPSLYWVCILWAALMKVVNRSEEAVNVLKNLHDDMANYRGRHPQSSSVKKLQGICCHNLAVSALDHDDLWNAISWVHQLKTIMANSNVEFPKQCSQLVEWAETTQSMVQPAKHHPHAVKGR